MKKRHEITIRNLIDQIEVFGFVKISKKMLTHWYSQERMSKTIWRDIVDRLPEDFNSKDIQVFQWADTIILIDSSCMTKLSQEI